jgi:hypothetical protein
LEGEDWLVVRLWREFYGGGMTAGRLPYGGGLCDQPCALLHALESMSGAKGTLMQMEREAKS